MRKLLFVPFILLFAFSSCKKSSTSSGSGTITATIDGKSVSFNTSATAIEASNSGNYTLEIVGYEGAVTSSNNIAIDITSPSAAITAGSTYSDSLAATNMAAVGYVQEPGNVVYTNLGDGTTIVKITSISTDNVQGTFNSNVNGGTVPPTHTITNGTFNLKLTN